MANLHQTPHLRTLIRQEARRGRAALALAGVAAAGVTVSSVTLLAVSGWFIVSAALAGAAGAALAFNYMLPAAGIRLLAITRTAARYGERLKGHEAALGALARIRPALFAALARAPARDALSLSTGEASARFVQDVDAIEGVFVRRSNRWAATGALVSGAGLAALGGPLAGVSVAVLFLATILGARRIARWGADTAGQDLQQASGRLKDAYAAMLAAAPELVCYGLQDWAVARVAEESAGLAGARRRASLAQGWQAAWGAAMAASAAAASLLLSRHAPLPLASLAALAAGAAMEGALVLARGFDQSGVLHEAARRLDPLLASEASPPARPRSAAPCLAIHVDRLDPIELTPGERLMVVGPSGCGKTTLLEQLLKLRDTGPHRLRIGGVDVVDLAAADARRSFAYAPQDAGLLAGTVREALELGVPDADEDALWAALADAALDGRVRALPQGLDTWIGDGGERLSGGEKRRLSLARALLRPAPWLLLDEPTEGLDATTEQTVIARLASRLHRTGQGLIVVTHRPALLGLGGRVLRLGDGCSPRALSEAA